MLSDILFKRGLIIKETMQRSNYVIYLKKAQEIADVLTLIGATNARMKLENSLIMHQLRGNANRVANCDHANVNKQITVARKQVEQIRSFLRKYSLATLPEDLQTIARLRLNNTTASLEELGSMLSPPLSKSGVNHRMQRLMKLLREEE